ncbi:MAG: FecR domain-containing protein [bacterium]|nr:FecR domain-containing protein [bacterium]
MENRDTDTIIAKWLAGEISDEEFVQEESHETLEAMKLIASEVEQWSIPPVDKVQGMARLQERLDQTKQEAKVIPLGRRWITGIAAAIALIAVSYLVFFNSDDLMQYNTVAGELEVIELPDGSTATLNSSSSLSYAPKSWPKKRRLKLKGEAYFEVAKGSTFTVEIDDSKVEVLGTKFNVRKRQQFLSVECFEGKVGVTISNSDSTSVILAGENIQFDGSDLTRGRTEDIKPIWIDGNSTKFKNAALGDVFEALKAQFGITIEYDPKVDLSRKYSGSFVHSNVETALRMVCDPLSLSYKKAGSDNYQIY